ncbi:hypothetical protein Tco_0614867 [Tanacetum coccineum]
MTETMEQYMSKTRREYRSGVARPKIDAKAQLELKGQFLKELCDNTFSGSEHEDANEHIKKVIEIVDLFHIPDITQDQIMLRAFLVSLTRAASPNKRKWEEINNLPWVKQEPDESLFCAWERFKELMMKYPQHYLTDTQKVILFYNGLDVLTRQILDSRGAIPTKTAADAEVAIQEIAEYSQKWHNGTSLKSRSTETSDGLAAIQAKLNSLGREKKELKRNNGNSSYPARRETMEESLSKLMTESAKRHKENSNIIKEIRAPTDAAIRNQGASIKTLELQIGQMSKVLQERGFGSLPSSTKTNPKDQVKSISTATTDLSKIRRMETSPYTEAHEVKILDAIDHNLPQKEKDPRIFTLPCFINNVCFDKSLVELVDFFRILEALFAFGMVVEGVMLNELNEGSIYKLNLCYGITQALALCRKNDSDKSSSLTMMVTAVTPAGWLRRNWP